MTELTLRLSTWTSSSFRALGDRNFRLYLFGLIVSLGGSYMQQVAEGWLVYRLSNSAFTLGLVGFIVMIPLIPWVLVSGALADRLPRKALLTFTQIGQVLPPLILAALVWTNQVQVWHVVVVDIVMAALSALDQPARQAMVVDATRLENRDNAIALSGAGFSLARVIGPAIAGLLLANFGEAICFAVNGLSFLAVALALLAMQLPRREPPAHKTPMHTSLFDGVRYLGKTPVVVLLLALIVIINLFIVPYQTLLPVFARDVFEGGALALGLLVTATGVGAVAGSLAMANQRAGKRGVLMVGLTLIASIVTIVFTLSRSLALASLALVVVSGAIVAIKVLTYTLIQAQARDDMRGRVMSFVVLFDSGFPRLGGLVAGYLSSRFTAPFALQLLAVGCIVSIASLGFKASEVRRIA